jgi:hypothetical protein
MVGSIYDYFTGRHEIRPEKLNINYRSSKEIVSFCRHAGYDEEFQAHHPDLKLALTEPLPDSEPTGWPDDLTWQPEWNEILYPDRPVGCFVYNDTVSGQSNSFEADSIAALLFLLSDRLAERPAGLVDENGNPSPAPETAYDPEDFWTKGVGVVTPHKAQMGRTIESLQKAFPEVDVTLLRSAVDTVERFQGQQRDIIIGSFGLGDPDAIRDEDEFLYSLTRFNVMASRARVKLLAFATRSIIDHLSNDLDTLRESRLLKVFADAYCDQSQSMTLQHHPGGSSAYDEKRGSFKYHGRN